MSNQQTPMQLLEEIVKCVSHAMAILDQFETSRSGNIVFERLEEALMWSQVMAHNVTLKPQQDDIATIVPQDASHLILPNVT